MTEKGRPDALKRAIQNQENVLRQLRYEQRMAAQRDRPLNALELARAIRNAEKVLLHLEGKEE